MHAREHPITPLAAAAAGLLAGAVGTVSMDAVRYVRYRRAGGQGQPAGMGIRAGRQLG